MQVLQHLLLLGQHVNASQSFTVWEEMHMRAQGIAVSNKYLFSFWH